MSNVNQKHSSNKMISTHTTQRQGTTVLDSSLFHQAENKILGEIMEMTKSLLNTFKFQIIYHARVSQQTEAKTLKLVKAYRRENKDRSDYIKELFPSK